MNQPAPTQLDRRNVLKGVLAASVSALVVDNAWARAPTSLARDPLRIPSENRSPGILDLQRMHVRLERPTGCRLTPIEGYCSRQSVAAGATIDIMVSADPPDQVTIEIFRMGYYGGCGRA